MSETKSRIWAVLRRREVITICLFAFLTDMIIGIVSPTLSLFAQSLGASLSLVGILAATMGLARFGSSLFIGTFSDRRGRKSILMAGMALMALAALLYSVVTVPYGLLGINVLFGVGFTATLTIALAYLADVTSVRERSLVFGLITTAMGLGFALGSLLGGRVAASSGYPSAYLIALLGAVAAFGLAWRGVPDQPSPTRLVGPGMPSWKRQLGVMLANPLILAACVGTILSNLVFNGLIVTFVPIYANGLGMGQALIGSLFATRALASTFARLPAGALGTIFPGYRVMLAALIGSAIVAFALPQSGNATVLMLLLMVEGVAYGLYLTSGQTTVAEHADPSSRGAALGMYMAAASVGDSVAPFFLGIVADRLGIITVFYVVGGLAVVGVIVMARILMGRRVEIRRVSERN
ncbi:MAG: multidrug resistance protein [Chloroflexota bacterium]|nr:MAG: multidrug resistance protein [Chloroflexota bacterium]